MVFKADLSCFFSMLRYRISTLATGLLAEFQENFGIVIHADYWKKIFKFLFWKHWFCPSAPCELTRPRHQFLAQFSLLRYTQTLLNWLSLLRTSFTFAGPQLAFALWRRPIGLFAFEFIFCQRLLLIFQHFSHADFRFIWHKVPFSKKDLSRPRENDNKCTEITSKILCSKKFNSVFRHIKFCF